VSYLVDEHGVGRFRAAVCVGAIVFALGVPTSFETPFLELIDGPASEVLLVLTGLLLALCVGWRLSDAAKKELSEGVGDLGVWANVWIWTVRVPVLLVLASSLVLSVIGYVTFLSAGLGHLLG